MRIRKSRHIILSLLLCMAMLCLNCMPALATEMQSKQITEPDGTPPVITVDPEGQQYYCKAPTVTVTDAGGNLESIVAESSQETIEGELTDEGKNGTVRLKDGMGNVTITARDTSGEETIKKIYVNHNIESIRRTDLPANCTEPLRRVSFFVCGICHEEYGSSVTVRMVEDSEHTGTYKVMVPALGHDISNTEEISVPACGEPDGEIKLHRCKNCNELIDGNGKIYEPKQEGHDWSEEQTKEPSCLEPGYKYIECKTCHLRKLTVTHQDTGEDGKTLTEEARSLRPLGHLMGEWKVAAGQEVSCLSSHQEERKCKRDGCPMTETRTMPAGNHTWGALEELVPASCTTDGRMGYKCTRCGVEYEGSYVTIPATGHTFDENTDCTRGGICKICRTQVEGQEEHTWSTKLGKDSTGHWKVCTVSGCNGKSDVVPHSNKMKEYDCTNPWSCSECGYYVKGNSSHSVEYATNEVSHWQVCKVEGCTYKGKEIAHNYGDVKDCTQGQVCKVCGYVKNAPQENHNYEWVNYSPTMHWMQCRNEGCSVRTYSDDGPEKYGSHVYGVRDCTKGIKCTVCGHELFAAAVSHNFSAKINGNEEGHYLRCQNYNCAQVKPAGNHEGGTATCTQRAVCTICGQPYGEVDRQRHLNTVIEGEREATTNAPGYTGNEVCADCGTIVREGKEIPQLSVTCKHEYEKRFDAKKCWYQCKHCGHIKESIEHTFRYISEKGGHKKQCVSCKYTTNLAPHMPNPDEEDHNCATKLTCKDCGYEIEPALEHKFDGKWIAGSNGHWHECGNANCDQTDTEIPHEAMEDDGDCTSDVVCKDCGHVIVPKSEGHQYSGVWESDENGHYRECIHDGCTVVDRVSHIWKQDDGDCTTPVVCTVCSYIQTPGKSAHSFGGVYYTDEDGHWQACQNAGCNVLSGEEEHTGGTASCKRKAVCAVCGIEYGGYEPENHAGGIEIRDHKDPTSSEEGFSGDTYCHDCGALLTPGQVLDKLLDGHEHEYDLPRSDVNQHWKECVCGARNAAEDHSLSEWMSDSMHHWKDCSGCDMVLNIEDHIYEDGKCIVCNHVQEVHDHKYEWKYDDKGHEQRCAICGKTVNASVHTYEWQWNEKEHWMQCTACGYSSGGEIPHNMKWQADGDVHWKQCECGYQTEKASHTAAADDGDCTTAVLCTVCGLAVKEAQDAHIWGDIYTADERGRWHACMNENCTQKDYVEKHELVGDESDCTKDIHCKNCGYVVRPGNAAHSFGDTYTCDGKVHRAQCRNNGCTVTGTPEMHRGGEATCKDPAVCEVCNTAYGSRNSNNHAWGAWKVSVPATALREGAEERICTRCSAKETRRLEKLKPTVEVNASTVPLKVGQSTTKLKLSGLAAGDYVKSWKSSNKKVVTVSKKGKIKAKKAGKATITVTLASGIEKTIKVVIGKTAVKTKKIYVNSKKITMKKGKKYNLKATVEPITSLQKISYTSSDSKVATVSSKGVIKARMQGKVRITVKSGRKKAVVNVTVKK